MLRSGQIFTDAGLVDMAQLSDWLKARAVKETNPALLIRASSGVTLEELVAIQGAARDAGYGKVLIGAEERRTGAAPVNAP